MADIDERFEGVEFVLDDEPSNNSNGIVVTPKEGEVGGFVKNSNNEMELVSMKGKAARDMSIGSIMADRMNNPPSVEQLQDVQNRLFKRDPNFKNLSPAEKEKIMFDEIQKWHFDQFPKFEDVKKEFEEKPLTYTVDSLDKKDTVGVNRPHLNIKNHNINLNIASDGRTIHFNNVEELNKYRDAVKAKNDEVANKEKETQKIQTMNNMHNRKFE